MGNILEKFGFLPIKFHESFCLLPSFLVETGLLNGDRGLGSYSLSKINFCFLPGAGLVQLPEGDTANNFTICQQGDD